MVVEVVAVSPVRGGVAWWDVRVPCGWYGVDVEAWAVGRGVRAAVAVLHWAVFQDGGVVEHYTRVMVAE